VDGTGGTCTEVSWSTDQISC